ncbi:hypothetical protein [Burkholderia pyrrocinia]|uniref:hypothetical protein n=1 Tax=Burkholderia pyrrocinia TaxID=60550 RepID=UPI000ACF7522|nr:hypothetical protein [Burkholderia pyrrocinia]
MQQPKSVPSLALYAVGLVVMIACIMIVHEGPLRIVGSFASWTQRVFLGVGADHTN